MNNPTTCPFQGRIPFMHAYHLLCFQTLTSEKKPDLGLVAIDPDFRILNKGEGLSPEDIVHDVPHADMIENRQNMMRQAARKRLHDSNRLNQVRYIIPGGLMNKVVSGGVAGPQANTNIRQAQYQQVLKQYL